jgi:2-keto-4-pentenoate hydratase/2-oxohepta-3-ene-1,7-dioic acid hydratase in catechol pathway
MRIASYIADGKPAFGVVTDDAVVTVSDRFGGRYATLREAIAGGALDEMRSLAKDARPDRDLAGLTFLPVVPDPQKVLCVGLNYASHAAEQGGKAPEKPNVFTKFHDTLVAHEGTMLRPKASVQFDWEGELVVVIGRGGRAIAAKDALKYVAGYTCGCDGSVRDWIKIAIVAGKNFPASTPIGPWMVSADEIPDPSKLTLTTRLNGERMQHSGTGAMMLGVPELIEYCSPFAPLSPGDLIFTGTPDGIGARRTPPVWMKAGDVLEVEISKIGTLRTRIADEP